jgi:hypothetical protein
MNHKTQRQQGQGAIEILEEAVHLLRRAPAGLFALYYLGSLPFIIGLLFFWADMSGSAFAYERCAQAAFGLALLFLWMKCWQAVFARGLRAQIGGQPIPHGLWRRLARAMAIQLAIQPSGLFVLPIALLITLPFGWIYAFYQNVTAMADGESSDVKTVIKKAKQQALLWPKQNHLLMGILFLFGLFVFANVAMAILFVPELLRMLFGVETTFTKSGVWGVLNSTFLAATWGITYLCMGPLAKAVYVLRCFYGESLRSGEDLKAELKSLLPQGKIVAMLLLLWLSVHGAGVLSAATLPENPPPAAGYQPPKAGVSAAELDRSISDVISRREYAWRLPREKPNSEPEGLLASFMKGVTNTIKSWYRTLGRWWEKFVNWLRKILRDPINPDPGRERSSLDRMRSLRILIYVLLVLMTGTLLILFWRMRQRRRNRRVEVAGQAIPLTPDPTDEQVAADQLPEDGWLRLAREAMAQGDLRRALRALYLASLAYLAEQQLIAIARFKSNRDYELELRRRARARPDLLAAFTQNVAVFDRIWYGMHDVTHETLDHFNANLERIKARVQE